MNMLCIVFLQHGDLRAQDKICEIMKSYFLVKIFDDHNDHDIPWWSVNISECFLVSSVAIFEASTLCCGRSILNLKYGKWIRILRCWWWQFPCHSLLFGAPSLVEPGCYPGQVFNPMKHSESTRKTKVAQECLYVRLCWMILVLWFCFFSSWLDLGVKQNIECQKYFPISAKVMPWSL